MCKALSVAVGAGRSWQRAVVAGIAVWMAASAEATVLTFELTPAPPSASSYETTYNTYGDNVSLATQAGPGVTYNYLAGNGFTPNVVVDYSHEPNAAPSHTGHSTYTGTAAWPDGVDYLRYLDNHDFWHTFTPDPGYGVRVNSFLIETWDNLGGSPSATLNWTLRSDSTLGAVLASGTVSGMLPDTEHAVNTGADFYDGVVVLEINFSGTNNNGSIAIDNLNFDQQLTPLPSLIPEPSTMLLVGLGALGMIACARRRRWIGAAP